MDPGARTLTEWGYLCPFSVDSRTLDPGGQDFDGVRLFVYVFGRLGDAGSGVPG